MCIRDRVKGSHKALSGKLFQPDITSAINRYDQTLKDYDALIKEQEKLKGVIGEMIKANDEAAEELVKLNADLAQMTAKMKCTLAPDAVTLRKYCGGGDSDLGGIKTALNSIA